MSSHQDDKLQFHRWSTLMLDFNITVERFSQARNTIFLEQFIIEEQKLSDIINIALKKIHGKYVTTSQLSTSRHVTLRTGGQPNVNISKREAQQRRKKSKLSKYSCHS